MLVSVNVLAYWVSPLRLVLNLTKSLSWITPPPDSLHSAYALEAMKSAEKAAVANSVDTFIFIPFSSIYPTFGEEFKRIRGEVPPNVQAQLRICHSEAEANTSAAAPGWAVCRSVCAGRE